jgi:UDP-N-acetylmuramoyl-L-alanyl-D-glutamate--2,6-diaminopimelate ligase
MNVDLAFAVEWLRQRVTGRLRTDSRQVGAGDAFVAWPGAAVDGRRFVPAALAAGAAAVLVEAQGWDAFDLQDDRVLPVDGLKALAGPLASAYLGQPSDPLDVVAITGTNGKTSCAWWLSQLLSALNEPTGLVGTLGVGRPALPNQASTMVSTGLTTPDPVALHQALRGFVDAGVRACALEASSIGIEEHRLSGCRFAAAMFTNFTQDHLDYHGSMQAYWQAKARLFDWPGLPLAVVHTDDPKGMELAQSLVLRIGLSLMTYGVQPGLSGVPHVQALDVSVTSNGQRLTVLETDAAGIELARQGLDVPWVGQYNVLNLLGVMALARARGHRMADIVSACRWLTPVPGRMERAEGLAGQAAPLVLVDYAHTPDALEKALLAVRPLAQARQGRVSVVVGCGGDRDASKRPLMAAAAEQYADTVVLTSDNPRSENPLHILADMQAGLLRPAQVRLEPDRGQAIAAAVAQAADSDVVLIAGKGHEDTQEVAGIKSPFSDRLHAEAALRSRATQGAMS